MKHYRLMLMQFVAHLFRRVTSAAFAKAGITRAQPWILDYLSEHDGCIQRELADRSHFDFPVDRLFFSYPNVRYFHPNARYPIYE